MYTILRTTHTIQIAFPSGFFQEREVSPDRNRRWSVKVRGGQVRGLRTVALVEIALVSVYYTMLTSIVRTDCPQVAKGLRESLFGLSTHLTGEFPQ